MKQSAFLALTKKYGTPLYVYDRSAIEAQAKKLTSHFPGVAVRYAMKANSNLEVLKIIRKAGIGIEAVSRGEIERAYAAGFAKDGISFTCSNLTESELRYAARYAGRVYLDSLTQLELWGKGRLGKEISLRLNQGIGGGHHAHVITGGPDSKFGIDKKDIPAAKRIAKKYGLLITGLMQHIGSNVLDSKLYVKAARALITAAADFPDVIAIDFGGGLGVPYKPEEDQLDLAALGKALEKEMEGFAKKQGRGIQFAMEPGRFLVAEAGTLLVTVTDIKITYRHTFVGLDSGFNHLVRPAMYGSYHPIENLSRKGGKQVPVTVAGNICESGDLFAVKRMMPLPKIGDVLAIRLAGAYGYSMASTYNLRPLPKEIIAG
ncbi:MAG TPA: diaminopimelate decarboxylase [Candidatus Paceibacterota bacterium]|nr:diaminopimelate decarboxylase [Candidatus Paceibacterota bacterium]